jgi:hypothetical protein
VGSKGGDTLLGRVVPLVIGCIGAAVLSEVYLNVKIRGWATGIELSVFLLVLAVVAGLIVWMLLRTAWLVMLVDDTFVCLATARRWTLGPGEIVGVKGDVYSQFLVILSNQECIRLWANFDDCAGLLAAIRQANPDVVVDPWVERRAH